MSQTLTISREMHVKMYRAACRGMARSTPVGSNYPVGNALWLTNGQVVSGGNLEVRRTRQSIHAEGSAATRALQRYRGARIRASISVDRDLKPLEACGDCRELLLEYAADDFGYVMSQPGEDPVRILDRDAFLPPTTRVQQVSLVSLDEDTTLISAALDKLSRAREGCTGWPTTAAIRLRDGSILEPVAASRDDGAYYGEHAVESALVISVSDGRMEFDTIAVTARSFNPNECGPIPCGRCLQKLSEAGRENKTDIRLIMADPNGNRVTRLLSQMLPGAFVLT